DMLFRAFHRQIRPTADTQDLTPVLRHTGRTRGEDGGHGWKETDNDSKRLGKLSVLRTITRLLITARPELQMVVTPDTDWFSDWFFVPSLLESSCMCMQCCGPARSCSLQGFDKDAECVFLFERPLFIIRWSMFTPYFEVCDSEGISAARIQGSCCNTRCLSEQELQVRNPPAGHFLSPIFYKWPGYNEECNMDHYTSRNEFKHQISQLSSWQETG
uniref:Phospholipid scramblase n=1 Tax=Sinocyclocheilus grahami TaxID=75366 RepID=A0A672RPE3_SINGR